MDHIPQYIKDDFKLPKDMSGLDIDYVEVRAVDAMFKRRQPEWSGQDVLDLHLNMKKSTWVLSYVNKLRVWPKGFYNSVKKFRNFLKYIVRSSIFDNAMTFSVLINTIGMAMEAYDMDE